MDFLDNLVLSVNDVLYAYVLIILLVGLGIWFTFRTGFVQLRCIKEMVHLLCTNVGASTEKNHISPFQAFCISTASRVGVGNIAGIAIAIIVGGPGAIFWMWVMALIGSATGFVESTLAQIYKVPRAEGGFRGGPAYYIKNALHNNFMAVLFVVLICSTYGLIFNSVQANTITLSLQGAFGFDRTTVGIIVSIMTAMVIFGGINRIAKVSEWMVPVMAGIYLLIAFYVVIKNINLMPQVIYDIVTSAFSLNAAFGGGMGLAMMTGIKRGLFSNEAGMGSVPNAAATATTDHPVTQGLIQALGVFVDTLLVCTASAFIVMLSKDYMGVGLSGIELVQYALVEHIGAWSSIFLAVMIFLFAFSSIIGNYYYGEINIAFMWQSKKALNIFRIFVVLMVMFGSVAKVSLVWNLADLFMALMAITNLIAISRLAPNAYLALKDYLAQKKAGIKDPVFKASVLKDKTGVEVWKD